ncbi:ergothioneine biosynthesis protein EgtB [Aporhodopirellula aestuarii]|uniref:Ergothioneine biosynthesis protein EgtB n=1 Tax=Aporhodopirellula aestuarii TaxID=2950107 RepID=A0ABT0U0R8_9BACT|nr:ergothioneine biosynthesis protein EgtB [Aporhodopirellula aestuarii]MCM2370471.1 ergothioneine biosynthesis protein EgtB [Aporhodopirellula aestuarii]
MATETQTAEQTSQRLTDATTKASSESIKDRYRRVRELSMRIAAPLSAEDCAIQSMPDASPTRWHLAHTTWFFETFLLKERPGFAPFNPSFERLFNSYYNSVGQPFPRNRRGQISRPGLNETIDYRRHVDDAVTELLSESELSPSQLSVLELGLNHEQQHQELMFTDVKHALASNPLHPIYAEDPFDSTTAPKASPLRWRSSDETIVEVGHDGNGFAYDNEGPRHRELIHPHQMASRCVTNREYLEFIHDGGYRQPEYWLSLGWDAVNQHGWEAPLHWISQNGDWHQFTLSGVRPLVLDEPVCHVSYFEADAFARWSGKRLPTEFEWEHAASGDTTGEIFCDKLLQSGGVVHPRVTGDSDFLGNVWEWTASQYLPYPGYRPVGGALGEYNGKFMCNQFVLRGGSCATSSDHIRLSYRNFFPPDARWQFAGIRLAQ